MRLPAPAVLEAAVARAGEAHGHSLAASLRRVQGLYRPIGVAVSGGADSVLALLVAVAVCGADRAIALHFDHGLRGRESTEDARYVAALARALGVRSRIGRWRAAARAALGEDGARRARLRFLARAAGAVGTDVVVLGHHAGDVAESQLLALARGASASALAAPLPVSHVAGLALVRPLLEVRPETIREQLRRYGVPWREDGSNTSRAFTRNRLRLDVVPAWIAAVPQEGFAGCLRTRRLAEEEEEALQAWVDHAGFSFGADRLDLPAKRPPAAVVRRALQRWLAQSGRLEQVRAAVRDAVVSACVSYKPVALDVGPDARLVVDEERVSWVALVTRSGGPRIAACLRPGGTLSWGGGILSCDTVEVDEQLLACLRAGGVDPGREAFLSLPMQPAPVLRVRTWRPGDAYRPLGAPGRAKLHDQFVNRHIRTELRHNLPVVEMGGRILWCPGLPPAEETRVVEGMRWAVRLTYRA